MKNLKIIILVTAVIVGFASCKKDTDPIIVVAPSTGSDVSLNGIVNGEAGSVAGNSVYLDLSTNNTTAALRSGWDLAFYSGSDFRVVLNNTSSAGIKVTSKFDLASVNAADTISLTSAGLTLATSQTNPQPSDLAYFDDINGDLTKTAIPAVSATDAANPVIILNRGTGGSIAARPWIKLRVLRNNAGGYTLQYAGIQETTFKTLNIAKDGNYNFQFVSLDKGIVNVEPTKANWDITWSYSIFSTNFGSGTVPYNFSDLIAVNYLAGVQVKEKIYASATLATAAFTAFNKDSIASNSVIAGRWSIGSNWRSTQPATGARLDRFYIIKDPAGNYYKLRCLSMGVNDTGVRGIPKFSYSLIAN